MTAATSTEPIEGAEAPLAPLSVERYGTFEELGDIEAEWDAFAEAVGGDIYATFAWCRTWWRFYSEGRRLALFLFRQGGRLVGVFPLFFETIRLLASSVRFVRSVGCDHSVTTCGPLMQAGMEQTLVGLLSAELAAQSPPWDALQIGPLPGYARRVDALESGMREHLSDCNVRVSPDGQHTVFALPDTFDVYFSGLSAKQRARVRQDQRRLTRGHEVQIVFHETPARAKAALARCAELHEKLWRAQGKLGHFRDWPKAAAFHEALVAALAKLGRVHVSELLVDNTVVASQYGFRFGKVGHWFLTARVTGGEWPKLNVGRLLFLENVRSAIERGVTLLDGLGGYYEYKTKLGGRLMQKRTIIAVRRRPWSRARMCLFERVAWVANKVYYRLWFARLGPRLRLLRRPLWEFWIRSQG